MKNRLIYFILTIFFIMKASLSLASISIGDVSNESFVTNFIPNGSIYDIVQTNDRIFLAGNFSYLGSYKGGGFILNLDNNLPLDLKDKIDGIVWEVISDDNGGWYVGGDFNRVGKYNIKKLAHILPDGSVDPNFSFEINDTVYALAKNGNVLFVGGAFENIEGESGLNYLAAFDLRTNSLIKKFKIIPEDFVFDLAVDPLRNKLYIAGQFISLYNVSKNTSSSIQFLAAIDLDSNSVDENFNFDVSNIVSRLLLSRDYRILYFGGYFQQVSSLTRKYLAGIDLDSNQLLTSFAPNLDYVVLALAQSNDRGNLYIGGRFRTVNNVSLNYLALINSSTGSLIPTFNCQIESDDNDPDNVNSVLDLKIDPENNILYVAGSFKKVSNQTKHFFFAAKVNNNQCRLVDEINFELTPLSSIKNLNINDRVNILGLDANKLFLGGRFFSYQGVFKKYLVAINKITNQIETNFNVNVDRPVYKLLYQPTNNYLYLIGYFNRINNVDRKYLASINLNDYSLTNLNVNFMSGDFITDAVLDGDSLYLSGYFRGIDNYSLKYLAKINTLTSKIDSSFKPPIFDGIVTALVMSDNALYVGGDFTDHLKVLDKNTGNLIPDFKVSFNGRVNDLFIDRDNNFLFVGGAFSRPNQNFVILDSQNGSIINKDYSPNRPVLFIKGDESLNLVFVTGFFDNLINFNDEKKLMFVLNYDGLNFSLNPWNLTIEGPTIYTVYINPNNRVIYLGGDFSFINQNNYLNNLLAFNFTLDQERKDSSDKKSVGYSGGGRFFSGGGGGSSSGRITTSTITSTTSDEALRSWLLQFVMTNLLSQQKQTKTTPTPLKQTKTTPTSFKSRIKGIPDGFQFTRTLKLGMKGQDVRYLQIFLKSQGKNIYPEGKITGVFTNSTKKAVIRFQEKYKKELKIKKADGIVRGTTLTKINKMIRGK